MAKTFLNNKLKLPGNQKTTPEVISNKPSIKKDPVKQAEQIKQTDHKDFAMVQAKEMNRANTNQLAMKKSEELFYVLDKDGKRLNNEPQTMEDITSKHGSKEDMAKLGYHFTKVVKLALMNEHGQCFLGEKE